MPEFPSTRIKPLEGCIDELTRRIIEIRIVAPPYSENGPDIKIRKVKVLQNRIRAQADSVRLNQEYLVIIKTATEPHQPPVYELEKIGEDPVSFLLKKVRRGMRR